jgi:hypothetical protein
MRQETLVLREFEVALSARGHKETSRRPWAMSLCPRKQTSTDVGGMSALCQNRTHALQQRHRLQHLARSARWRARVAVIYSSGYLRMLWGEYISV